MFKTYKKPLSQHLGIYLPQLTSMLSIFHRITGILLVLCLVFPFFLYKLYINHIDCYEVYYFLNLLNDLNNPFSWIFMYLILLSFFYHFFNGIRHFLWDLGQGFSLKAVYTSGYLVVFLTFLISTTSILLIYINLFS